jgi:uncharacterized membrane protein YhaH (DUF805 family)
LTPYQSSGELGMSWRWFDARGAIGRRDFLVGSTIAFLIGGIGFLAVFLTTAPARTFTAFGHMLDHRSSALADMGVAWAGVALTLWLAQILVLAVLSARRLHDMGQSGWMACLSFVPGVQTVFWLALCLWPAKDRRALKTA